MPCSFRAVGAADSCTKPVLLSTQHSERGTPFNASTAAACMAELSNALSAGQSFDGTLLPGTRQRVILHCCQTACSDQELENVW